MFGMMLVCVGVLVLVAGLVTRGRSRVAATRALEVSKLPPTAVSQIGGYRRVRVDGVAAALEGERLLVAPCSGLPAVWFRVRVHRLLGATGTDGGSLWQVAIDEQEGTSFELIERSGGRARVVGSDADVLVDSFSHRASAQDLSPKVAERLGEFLSNRGYDVWMGDSYDEQCISPGDRISVVGVASRAPGPPVEANYRDAPSSQLVFKVGSGERLILATRTAVERQRYGAHRLGGVAAVVGLIAVVVGAILQMSSAGRP